MEPREPDNRFVAREIEGSHGKVKIVAVTTIVLMMVLFSATTAILLIGGSPSSGSSAQDGLKGTRILDVMIDNIPEQLVSRKNMKVEGLVSNDNGIPVDGVSVAVTIDELSQDVFRTVSDPDGRFSLDMNIYEKGETGNYSLKMIAQKQDFETFTDHWNLSYLRPPTWNFMVYMSDCDLEKWAVADINEMERIGSTEELNILVQIDRWESISNKDDTTNGNWTTAKRFRIESGMEDGLIESEEMADLGEINSADPDELVDFVKWGMEEYPADRNALILWNHGSGTDGICWEQSGENEDVMTIPELRMAMEEIDSEGKADLDIIGFDACLMSAVEVAYEINPFADTMIGSEVTEPTYGWDYSSLGEIQKDPYMEPGEIGSLIVDDYIEQLGEFGSKKSMSLGVYDLDIIPRVVSDLNELSNTISAAGSAELYNMKLARKYAQPIQEGHSSDAVDLYDLVENIHGTTDSSLVLQEAERTMDSIDDSVLYFRKVQVGGFSLDGLNGLSVYAPDFQEIMNSNEDYSELKMSVDSSWTSLLEDYHEYVRESLEEKVLAFDVSLLSCSTSDSDSDGCRDTMNYHFSVHSSEDDVEAYMAINVYNLRGDHISSLGHDFNISSEDSKTFTVSFTLDPEDGGPAMYRISAFLCRGNSYDPSYFQDHTRSGYRWLESTANRPV